MVRRTREDVFKKWYIATTAFTYAVICGIRVAKYVYLELLGGLGADIPIASQVICGLAILAGLGYFFRPKIGHHGLVLVTCTALYLATDNADVGAVIFHVMVLMVLSVPVVVLLRHRTSIATV